MNYDDLLPPPANGQTGLYSQAQMVAFAKECLRKMVEYVDDNTEIPFASTGYSPSKETLYEEFDLNEHQHKQAK